MLANRSIPESVVIPELPYKDVAEATAWICETFGFTLRLRIANHRAQINVGSGAVVLTERDEGDARSAVMVRVEDAAAHHERSRQHGARILRPPTDYPFGERQYTVEDLGGHRWTFTQSIADVDPTTWGGEVGQL